MESNPTQLDQLLNDSTSKISQLEQTISSLRTDKEEMAAQHEQTVKERDQQLVDVQQQLADAKALEADASAERDTIRDDMAALSQAYASLETEYRAQQTSSGDRQQETGESSQSTTADAPTELGALRAENARLRDDVKNANEWMATAYDKMNELNAQNEALQQSLSSTASDPVGETTPMNGPDVSSLQTELETLRHELKEQSRQADQSIAERDGRIAELEIGTSAGTLEEVLRLRHDNEEAQKWMSQAVEHHQILTEQVNSLAQENEELKGQLARSVNSDDPSNHDDEILRLREEIEAYRAHKESMASLDLDLQSARAQCDALRAEIVVKDQELHLLASNNLPRGDTAEESLLQDEVSRLQSELKQSQTETSRSIEELTESLERIASLESRVAELTTESESRLAQIQSFDVGLAQNREIAHTDPQNLRGLEEEKDQLKAQLLAQKEDAEGVILQWQESYGQLKSQNDEMQAELQRYLDEAECAKKAKHHDSNQVQSLADEGAKFEAQLQAQKEEAANVILQWQDSYEQLKAQKDEMEAELRKYVDEVECMKKDIRDQEESCAEPTDDQSTGKDAVLALEQQLQNLKEQLSDQERDASETIAQWQETYDALEEKLRRVSAESDELSARNDLSQQEVTQLRAENADLVEKANDLNARIEELNELGTARESELSSLRQLGAVGHTNADNEHIDALQSTIENLQEQLKDQIEESQQISTDWEESYAAQTVELEDCKANIAELEVKLRNVEVVDNEIMENMDSEWQQKFEEKQEEIEAMRQELVAVDGGPTQSEKASEDSLAQKVALLESQLLEEKEASKNILDQWEESYYDVTGQLDAANERLALLSDTSPAADQAHADGKGVSSDSDQAMEILKLRDEIARLRELLKEMERDESGNADTGSEEVRSLQKQLAEAQSYLVQWEQSYNDVKSELEEATLQLQNSSRPLPQDESALPTTDALTQEDFDELRVKLTEREGELEIARQTISTSDVDHVAKVMQLQEEISRLRELSKGSDREEFANGDTRDEEVRSLQEQLAEAQSYLVQWEQSYNDVKSELEEATVQLQNSSRPLPQDESALPTTDALTQEDFDELRVKLTEREGELEIARQTISTSDVDHVAKVMQLQEEISRLRELSKGSDREEFANGDTRDEEVRSLQEQLAEAQSYLVQWEQSYNDVKSELEEATVQLQNSPRPLPHDESAPPTTTQEAFDDLRVKLTEREGELEIARQTISTSDADHVAEVMQLQEEMSRLRKLSKGSGQDEYANGDTDGEDVRSLQEQLAEAQSYLVQWEESYNDIKSELEEVTAQLQHCSNTSPRDESAPSTANAAGQESADELRVKLSEREVELEIARQTVSNFERESWQQTAGNREIELHETIENLESRLEEERTSSADLLLQWEESYNGIAAQLDDATESLRLANDAAKETEHANAIRTASLEGDLATTRENLADKERQIAMMNENHPKLQDKIATLETELADEKASSFELVSSWETSYYELNARFEEVSKEIIQLRDVGVHEAANTTHAQDYHQGENAIEQESKLTAFSEEDEQGISTQGEADSGAAPVAWEAKYYQVLEELQLVNEKVMKLKEHETPTPQERSIALEINTVQHGGGTCSEAELQEKIATLESQIRDEQEIAKETLAQWETCYYDVSGQLDEANEQLRLYSEEPRDSADLERELQECKNLVLQWEASYATLESQFNDSMAMRPDSLPAGDRGGDYEELKTKVSMLQSELEDLQSSSLAQQAELKQALEDKERDLAESRKQATNQSEVEGNGSDLGQQLGTATETASQWEAAYRELESQLSSSQELLAASDAQIATLEASARENQQWYEQEISEAEAKLAGAGDELRARDQDSSQIDDLNRQLLEERDISAKWAGSYDDVLHQLEKAHEQITELHAATPEAAGIQQLEQELEEAKQIVGEWEQSYTSKADELQSALDSLAQLEAEVEALQTSSPAAHETATAPDQHTPSESVTVSESCLEKLKVDIRGILTDENVQVAEDDREDNIDGTDPLVFTLKSWIESNKDLVSQWESCYNDLDSQLRDANDQIKTLRTEVAVAEAALAVFENGNDADEDHERNQEQSDSGNGNQELLGKIESLEIQLVDDQKEATEIVEQWQTRASELEEQLAAANERLVQLEEVNRHAREDSPGMPSEESQNEITRLKAELSDSNETSRADIQKWEDEFAVFQKEAQEVITQWRDENENLGSQLEQSLEQNELHRSHIEDLRSQLELAQKQIESDMVDHALEDQEQSNIAKQLKSDLDTAVRECAAATHEASDLRDAIKSRELQVEELKVKLTESSRRSSELQSQAMESYVEEYLETIKRLEREVSLEKNEKRLTEEKLMQTNEQFKTQLEALESENAVSRQTIEAELAMYQERLDNAEESLRSLKQEKARMEDEFAALKSRNEELMDEVQGATAALQISASERASERANDVAISILKRQIDELHAQLEEEHSSLLTERTVRAQSEAEVSRLQANLTALLGLENTEHNRSLIEQRLVEATESFQRTERSEILMLKQSLERALQDLQAARASQKVKEEQAAKATYQSSLYEQELVKTKGDFDFLAQSMEEVRQADDSKIASLEYHLSSLSNEQSVQRKCHSIEMDKLRNELSQINMERDRLIQALKDSEKNREAVLQASSRDQKTGNGSDALAELARLRVEKAQLLAAASEEAAHTERKLRETRAASMAACEADILLEKELRLSAEKNLLSAKAELDQVRANSEMTSSLNGGTIRNELDALKEELDTTKQAKAALECKVETMTDHLAETEKTNKSEIARMTEECRKALARAAHLERQGRLEAEVIAEAARLSQEKDSPEAQQPQSTIEDEEREKRDRELELVGVIENQAHEFAQERSMYFNTFANMEDMHVFLAQQDILTNTLKDSLSQEAGRESLERAIREAEDKVKNKYGTYVKLS